MDYSTSAYHPYAEVYRRPLANPFPQGVALGTTGVPTRSAAARLLDIEHDFPGKFERRAEINRLKSKRRLEAMDYGLLPYNSWSTYLKPSTPARHYYSPQYTLDKPSDSPIVISRYPIRPLRMVQLAPLSVRCLPMPEQNADALTLEMEADDARFQSQQDARRIQSSIWQSEATDRAIRLCKDRNRIRNQLRRIENARLVGPIYSRLGAPEQLGTRQKVLINYHKGAKSDATPHHESAHEISKPKTEVKHEEFHETPAQLPNKKHEEVVKEAEVQQADESQRSQQSSFSVEEQRQEVAEPPPAEPEPPKQTIPRHEEEQERELEVEKEKEKKPKKEHKLETAKEKRRREQQEKKAAEQKEEKNVIEQKEEKDAAVQKEEKKAAEQKEEKKAAEQKEKKNAAEQKEEKITEPESPQIKTSLEPLSLKIKEQTNEKPAVEPASPGITETFVLPSPKAKKQIEPASPKIKEEITEPTSPLIKDAVFEPTSPKIKEKIEPMSPVFQPESPKIFEDAKHLSLKIKEQTSELTDNVLASPKIEEIQTPLQSPAVSQEKPALVAETETEVEIETPKEAVPVLEPEPEPQLEPEVEPEVTDVYESKDDTRIEANSSLVQDELPQFETQISVEDRPPQFESQKSVEDQSPQVESQKLVEDQSPQFESQKSVEEVTETLWPEEPHQEPLAEHADIERQLSVTSSQLPAEESIGAAEEVAPEKETEDQVPQSPTILRRLISNASCLEGDACDPSEWDADDAVEVELPSERKGIILSASGNAIPDQEDHHEAEKDTVTPTVTTEEPSIEEDRNLEPRVEEPDEETFKYDENVEYRSKSISIEEDE